MKFILTLVLVFSFASSTFAEIVCTESIEGTNLQSCQVVADSEDLNCGPGPNEIINKTSIQNQPMVCNDQELLGGNHTKQELSDIKSTYHKLCKKKAKAYKKALMGNLLKRGKVGQMLQVLFSKKRYISESKNGKKKKISMDASEFEGKSPEEIENLILDELEKQSGISGLKEKARLAQEKPEFKLGYHQAETVPVNVLVKTDKKNACNIVAPEINPYKEAPIDKCDFCVEKNISSSFTNDCAYMVNSKNSEETAKKLLGFEQKTDYCNANSMEGVNNDLTDVEKMVDNLCNIAKKGLKPDFKIETSRNQFRDKTVDLAAKRGEYIQKYIRNELLNGKRCDVDPGDISWLKEDEFKKVVRVEHPFYEKGKKGDYGPSPYVEGEIKQAQEIENLRVTLEKEKADLIIKNDEALKEISIITENIQNYNSHAKKLSQEYSELAKDLSKIKNLDQEVFEKKRILEEKAQTVGQLYEKINEEKQKLSDLKLQSDDLKKRIDVSAVTNTKKLSLLKEFYTEVNSKGLDGIDRNDWDEKLFNDFKMVRITGKAVEDNALGVDPNFITPSIKIALNALVDVDKFTCVVEPIPTHKVTVEGLLKGGLKIVTIATTPVLAAGAIGATVVAFPFTTAASFLCQGCGDPGRIPPALRFANPRALNLSKSSIRHAKSDLKRGWKAYTSWGGLLDVSSRKNYYENSTEEVWEEEQERKNK